MSQSLEVLHHLRAFAAHPVAIVVVLALLAALLEQRMARRGTPDFSRAYQIIKDHRPRRKPPR